MFHHTHSGLSSLAQRVRFRFASGFIQPLPRGAKALLAANVCLAAMLVAEVTLDAGAPPPEDPVMQQPTHNTSTTAHGNSISSAELTMLASNIMARPLFAPDRRPHQSVPQATTVTEPPVRLVGTIVSDHVRIAFLEMGEQRITRRVGDNVRNARIIKIDPGLVRLQSGIGKIDDIWLSQGTRVEPTPPPAVVRNLLRE